MNLLFRLSALCSLMLTFAVGLHADDDMKSLFDGKTLDGWETLQEDEKLWSVRDGIICAGSLDHSEMVPHNSFLSTKESYDDFELVLKIKVTGSEGFVNSGVQIRSVRVDESPEMSGYQVDAGEGWWGKLYDESRRNKVIGESKNAKEVEAAVKSGEWNEIRIVAQGKNIKSWINGVPALDYTEEDDSIEQHGHIGLQVHGGGKTLVQFKDIQLKKL